MIKKILYVLTGSVLFSSVLLLSYVMGLNKGWNSALTYLEENAVVVSDNKELIQTPQIGSQISNPKNIPVEEDQLEVDWGGPELWEAVNSARTKNGVNPLGKKDELCTIASIRLNELLSLKKLDAHEGFSNLEEKRPDLKWIFEKYNLAEFLIVGYETPEDTVNAWEHTLGHKSLVAGGEWVWGCVYSQDSYGVAITAY